MLCFRMCLCACMCLQDSLVKQGVAELQALKTKAERLQALRAAWDTELSATAYPVLHGLQQSETSKT